MLRIHLLQNLYDLSDMGARNEVIDSRAFSDFCGVESSNQIPDGDTIGKFRNLLIRNGIHEKFFAMVVKNLTDRGLILKKERSLIPPLFLPRLPPKTQTRKPTQIKKLSASGQRRARKEEHQKSSVRAKVEHVFAVIKGQFRYRKTRYRGLPKQAAKLNMLFALANLVLADRRCPAV